MQREVLNVIPGIDAFYGELFPDFWRLIDRQPVNNGVDQLRFHERQDKLYPEETTLFRTESRNRLPLPRYNSVIPFNEDNAYVFSEAEGIHGTGVFNYHSTDHEGEYLATATPIFLGRSGDFALRQDTSVQSTVVPYHKVNWPSKTNSFAPSTSMKVAARRAMSFFLEKQAVRTELEFAGSEYTMYFFLSDLHLEDVESPGVYFNVLVAQRFASTGYEDVDPFIIQIPLISTAPSTYGTPSFLFHDPLKHIMDRGFPEDARSASPINVSIETDLVDMVRSWFMTNLEHLSGEEGADERRTNTIPSLNESLMREARSYIGHYNSRWEGAFLSCLWGAVAAVLPMVKQYVASPIFSTEHNPLNPGITYAALSSRWLGDFSRTTVANAILARVMESPYTSFPRNKIMGLKNRTIPVWRDGLVFVELSHNAIQEQTCFVLFPNRGYYATDLLGFPRLDVWGLDRFSGVGYCCDCGETLQWPLFHAGSSSEDVFMFDYCGGHLGQDYERTNFRATGLDTFERQEAQALTTLKHHNQHVLVNSGRASFWTEMQDRIYRTMTVPDAILSNLLYFDQNTPARGGSRLGIRLKNHPTWKNGQANQGPGLIDGHSRNGAGFIHNYSWRPTPEFFPKPDPQGLFIGMELEVEAKNHVDLEAFAQEFLIRAREELNGQGLFFIKHDGSINHGFEIVTQPFTPEWGIKNFPTNIFREYIDNGTIQPKAATCGQHVHMSKSAFSPSHFAKFLHVHEKMTSLLATIGGRPANTSYANLENTRTMLRGDMKMRAIQHGSYRTGSARAGLALGNDTTVEMRYPAGDVRPTKILKNIEWARCVFDFSKILSPKDLKDLRDGHLLYWIYANEEKYPNLIKHLSTHKKNTEATREIIVPTKLLQENK